MAGVTLERIKIKDIESFAARMYERSGPDDLNPMPKHLARALANNPYAGPDDVAQFVLFDGDRCIGYCGSMPGRLRYRGELYPLAFTSTAYIHPDFRTLGYALRLMRNIIEQPIDIAGASMSSLLRPVIKRLGALAEFDSRIDDVLDLNRIRFKTNGILGKVVARLGRRSGTERRIEKVERWNERLLYPIVRSLVYVALGLAGRRCPRSLRFEEVDRIPDDALDGAYESVPTAFHRGVELINWRLQYPWVLSEHETDDRYPNYHFPAVLPLFRMLVVNLRNRRGGYRGFVVISISQNGKNNVMKLLDTHFIDPADRACITKIVASYGRRYGIDRVYMGEPLGTELGRNRFLEPLMVKSEHEYLMCPSSEDSPLALGGTEIELHTCDGDMAFT